MARTNKYHSSEIKRKRKPSPFTLRKRGWFMPSDLVMYCSLLLCFMFVTCLWNTSLVDAKLTITGSGGYSSRRIHLDLSDGGYKGIVVKINKDVPEKYCPKILSNIKVRKSSSLFKRILAISNFILIVDITTGLINAFNILRYYLPWVDIFFVTYQIMTNTLACSHCKVDMNTTWFFILCIYISSHTLFFFWWWNQWYKDETMLQLFFYQFLCLQKPGNFDAYAETSSTCINSFKKSFCIWKMF